MMTGRDLERQREPIVVVFCADDNFATLLAVALQSMMHHALPRTAIDLYILDSGISSENKQWIIRIAAVDDRSVRIQWVKPDLDRFRGIEIKRGLTHATYLRLQIPEILPETCRKAIYMDSDILIRTDLSRLWETEMEDKMVLAVRDPCTPSVSAQRGISEFRKLGLRSDTPYFNAGIMVLNLHEWRTKQVCEQALRYVSEFGPLMHCNDQEALNAVIAGNWGELDPRWNVVASIFFGERKEEAKSPYLDEIMSIAEDLIEHAYIFHFTGFKPTEDKCDHPARIIWHRYFDDSKQSDPDVPRCKPIPEKTTSKTESRRGGIEGAFDIESETDEMLRVYRELRDWINEEMHARKEIADVLSKGDSFILVDEGNFGRTISQFGEAIPFHEHEGEYWGPPQDDAVAIEEFEQLAAAGARYIVFAWPAFWWLEYYSGFESYLRSRYPRILDNDRLIIFRLRL